MSRQKELTQMDIVVLSAFILDGARHFVHLEDIAIKAAELAPKRFSWEKYPNRINLETVRLALKHELSATNCRIIGGIKDGFMLNPKGFEWCLNVKLNLPREGVIERVTGDIKAMKGSLTYRKILKESVRNITLNDVHSILKIDNYFNQRMIRERVMALHNAAVLDSQLKEMINKLENNGLMKLEV